MRLLLAPSLGLKFAAAAAAHDGLLSASVVVSSSLGRLLMVLQHIKNNEDLNNIGSLELLIIGFFILICSRTQNK